MTPQILKNVDVEIIKSEGPQRLITTVERLGLDTWDWVAIIIASISLIVAAWAAWLQFKTEKNTMKITEEGQFDLLVDYFRHFYANLIVTLAIHAKLNKRYDTHYPSEEHFRKLMVETDVLHPEAFFHSKDKYNSIHNLYLLIRNFNSECAVAEEHVCTKNIIAAAKDRDINTLIFKQDYFIERFSACIKDLCKGKGESPAAEEKATKRWQTYLTRAHDDILERAFERNKLFKELNLTTEEKAKKIGDIKKLIADNKIPNYWDKATDNNFVKILFPEDSELFILLLNYNIWCEITKTNTQGYDKIFILPFK